VSGARAGYARLEDQIDWYDSKSISHQIWYRRLKVISIASAALVPLFSSLDGYAVLAGGLGVVVVIVEGLQHVNQHHENWIRYRATCENLRREKYLYLAGAGGYEGMTDEQALRQLAAQVESVLSREGGDWLQLRRSLDQKTAGSAQSGDD
jgi:hypothetical protein